MANLDLFGSNKSIEWTTPRRLFVELNEEFNFTLDPCCTEESALCDRYYTKKENGLLQNWSGDVVFANPPYGRNVGVWLEKAYNESRNGAVVVCLVFSKTDTSWWHNYAMRADEIRYIRGRLKFGNAKHSAPFGSAILIFRNHGNGRDTDED